MRRLLFALVAGNLVIAGIAAIVIYPYLVVLGSGVFLFLHYLNRRGPDTQMKAYLSSMRPSKN
jgi:hypothetical protein